LAEQGKCAAARRPSTEFRASSPRPCKRTDPFHLLCSKIPKSGGDGDQTTHIQSDSVSSLQHQVTCAEVTVHILGLSSHAHTSPLKPVHLPVVSFCTSRSLLVFRRTPHRTVVLFISTLKRFAYNSPRFLKARKSSQESLLLGLFEAGMTCKFKSQLGIHRMQCWLARQCFGWLAYGISRGYPIICRRIACASDEAGRRVAIGSHAEGPAIGSLHFDKTCTGLQRNMTGLNIYPYNNVKDCTLQLEKLLRYNEK